MVVLLDRVGDPAGLRRRADDLVKDLPGAHVVRVSPSGRVVLTVPQDADPEVVAAVLDRRPDVAYAESDVVDRAQPALPGTHD